MVIIRNRAQCKKCDEIIESTHRHDFKRCSCGALAVDGGKAYLRRLGNIEDCIELSEYDKDAVEELEQEDPKPAPPRPKLPHELTLQEWISEVRLTLAGLNEQVDAVEEAQEARFELDGMRGRMFHLSYLINGRLGV